MFPCICPELVVVLCFGGGGAAWHRGAMLLIPVLIHWQWRTVGESRPGKKPRLMRLHLLAIRSKWLQVQGCWRLRSSICTCRSLLSHIQPGAVSVLVPSEVLLFPLWPSWPQSYLTAKSSYMWCDPRAALLSHQCLGLPDNFGEQLLQTVHNDTMSPCVLLFVVCCTMYCSAADAELCLRTISPCGQ